MRIGIVGTGNMGLPIARNLVGKGHELSFYARRPEVVSELVSVGAAFAANPAAVARTSDVAFTCLPGPDEVREVVLGPEGIAEGASAGMTLIDMTTNSPSLVRELHATLGKRGVEVVDAPISGGTYGAASGELAVMVGGSRATFDRLQPLLGDIGDKVVYCGEIGSGMVCKLTNNLINLSFAVVLGEALTSGVRAGVNLRTLFDAISASSGNSRRMQAHMTRHLFSGDFEAGFGLGLATKDVRLALEMARETGNPMKLTSQVYDELLTAIDRGWEDEDCDAVIKLQEEAAGLELRF
jgi:3-hydroxyisobutyrate dehydrogenase-like beta-hydroxyacid dehydrogenase